MAGYPNAQSNPAGAIPVWLAGATPLNLAANGYTQVKNGAGVFSGGSVNTAGTTSTLAVYDGKSSVVTMTIASPAVVAWAGHGLPAGTEVKFQTTGALPTGLTAGTSYYVSSAGLGVDSFSVADTQAHAIAGTNSINTSGTQSGVHTAYALMNKIGTYSTTAVGALPVGGNGAGFTNGLIVIAAGGAAADVTVLYR